MTPSTTRVLCWNHPLAVPLFAGLAIVALASAASAGAQACCPQDLNDDGVVDGDDLGTLLGQWGPCKGCSGEFNGDGVVDGDDLGTLLGTWGACQSPPLVPPTAVTQEQLGCVGAGLPVLLKAIGGAGITVEWFANECGGVPIATGTQYQPTIFQPTTFYARWTDDCGASNCASTFVNYIEPVAPTSVTASPSSIPCPNQQVTLTAHGGSGLVVWWYADGDFVGGSDSIIVGPKRTTTYCAKWIGTCGLHNFSSCTEVTVVVGNCD